MAHCTEARISEIDDRIANIQGSISSLKEVVQVLLKSERIEDQLDGKQLEVKIMRLVLLLQTLYGEHSSLVRVASSTVII